MLNPLMLTYHVKGTGCSEKWQETAIWKGNIIHTHESVMNPLDCSEKCRNFESCVGWRFLTQYGSCLLMNVLDWPQVYAEHFVSGNCSRKYIKKQAGAVLCQAQRKLGQFQFDFYCQKKGEWNVLFIFSQLYTSKAFK